ncbi:MAG: competence/damage-inducible protein A [Gemmatimonadota bacterium]|nr:MAG: competence/damage-inducible protein A [Gemmatimonadota bacterium]
MDLEVVTVGTELLLGFTLDTNAADIARSLASIGVRVVRLTTVGDDARAIRGAVSDGLHRSGFVIVTGGLGPTRDDITKQAVADIYRAPLELDEDYLSVLEQRFARLGRGPMPESNRTQAQVPRGAIVLPNRRGTAPGLWLHGEPGSTVLLPGIPQEMRSLLEREVMPRLSRLASGASGEATVTLSRTLRTTGVSESGLADQIGHLDRTFDPVSLAYLPGLDGVDLRLSACQMTRTAAESALARAVDQLRPVLGQNLYGEGDVQLAAVVLERLRASAWQLATAESCTGGLIGAKLTAVPGSSDVYVGGVVCYSNESKARDLGVPEELLRDHGAVSEAVVRAMAEGVCRRFGTAVGIAVTGIAGPGGGSDQKPRGTVWIAVQRRSRVESIRRWFPGGREEVRQRSAQAALDLVRRLTD